MLSGLNHLTLAVSQLVPSVAFYQQLLGMTLHARWDSGAYLSCGDLWLCLSLDPQRRTPVRTVEGHALNDLTRARFGLRRKKV